MSLLVKSRKGGQIRYITPQSAGWCYIGFDVWMLKRGQTMTLESGDRELCLVPVAGLTSVKTRYADLPNLGKQISPSECTLPWLVHVPPQDRVEVTVDFDLELTVCSAPGKGCFPACLIRLGDVDVEHRGKGHNQRRVHNIPPDSAEADCLLVVEVYIDEGTTSSWPSRKHDTAQPGKETQLEETYYHHFDPPQGFASQRAYTGDRSLDTCMAPCNHGVVMVPYGYHPVVAIADYNSYHLNMMAGLDRKWLPTWEDDHVWINTLKYPRHD